MTSYRKSATPDVESHTALIIKEIELEIFHCFAQLLQIEERDIEKIMRRMQQKLYERRLAIHFECQHTGKLPSSFGISADGYIVRDGMVVRNESKEEKDGQ